VVITVSQRARLACTLSGPQLCTPFGFTSSCPNASGWVLVYSAAAHMYCRQPPPKTSSAACGSRHAGTPWQQRTPAVPTACVALNALPSCSSTPRISPDHKRFCHAASTPARRLQRAAAALPDPARATGSHSFSPLTAPTPCAHRPTINKRERDFEGDSALWAGKSERAAPARRQSMPPRSRCSAGAAARVAPVQDDAQRDGAQAAIGGHRRLQEALRAAAPQWSRRRSGHDLGAGARRRTRPVCGCAAPHAAERR